MYRTLILILSLLVTLPVYAQPPAPAGGDMSNTTTKATNSITARKLGDRAADTCNILDQLATDGDAAAAFMRCLGTGKPQILFPPGQYVIKSMTTPVGIFLAPVAFSIDHISEVHVEATGATFTMANAIVTGSWHIFMAYKDSKNISWHGGTFILNPLATSGAPGLVNAFCWNSTTNLQISEVILFANGTQSSAFCGTWGFENIVTNNWAYGFRFAFDLAYEEDLLANGNFFDGTGSPLPVQGFSVASVPANYCSHTPVETCVGGYAGQRASTWPDGSFRSLRNGQSNGLKILNNTFASSATGIKFQDVNGAIADGNVITGPNPPLTTGNNNGFLINTDANTNAEGFITKGVTISNNTITGVGNSTTSSLNGGILLADGGFGLSSISIINNAIYDNCGKGIAPNGVSATNGILISGNNFISRGGSACTQVATIDAGMMTSLGYNNLQTNNNSDTTVNLPSVGAIAGSATTLGGHPRITFSGNQITIYGSDGSGADRIIAVLPLDSSASTFQFRAQVRDEQPLIIGGGTTGGAGTLTITPGATTTNPVVYSAAGTGGHQLSGKVIMPGLPSNCTGAVTGTLWNNASALGICP